MFEQIWILHKLLLIKRLITKTLSTQHHLAAFLLVLREAELPLPFPWSHRALRYPWIFKSTDAPLAP